MAARLHKRPCRFCLRWFLPDVRQREQQYACSAPECQSRRQAANQSAWLENKPGYFRDRTEKNRAYREAHPDAKRQWRAANPEVRDRENIARARHRKNAPSRRAVAQEAIMLQLVNPQGVTSAHAPAVAQEALMTQLHVLVGLASALPPAVAQEPIAGALSGWNDRGRQLLAGARAREPVRPR